jgi:tetratricopeptide (TPR) repeat protein
MRPVPKATLRWVTDEERTRLSSVKFLPLLRSAVAALPERVDPKLRLARALFRAGHLTELVEWLAPSVNDAGAHSELLHHFGVAAATMADEVRALAALQRAAALGFAPSWGYLAEVLLRLGRTDEALAAGLRGLEAHPSDFKPLGIVARILLERGQLVRLWELCVELRRFGAWGGYIPSAMAHAASNPQHCAEVAALVDRAQWFCVRDRSGPFAFARWLADDFDDQLRKELLAHPSLTALPATKATTGTGNRIDQLHLAAGPSTSELLRGIRLAVDAYFAERVDADHPIIARCPKAVSLDCWAIAVQRDGHETWHIHPQAWLSGVYYVAVPEVAEQGTCAGTIGFGPMPLGRTKPSPAWPHWRVQPQPGQILLFPSYFGHRTWSTGSDDVRLCVAFDVLPAKDGPRAD